MFDPASHDDLHEDVPRQAPLESELAGCPPLDVLFMAAPMPLALSRRSDGRLLAVNDAWVAFNGVSREEALGQTTLHLGQWLRPQDRQRFLDSIDAGETVFTVDAFTGALRRVRIKTRQLAHEGQALLLVSLEDITGEFEAEQRLVESNRRLQREVELHEAIEKLAHVGHWMNAEDDEHVLWSSGMYAITGMMPDGTMTRTEGRSTIHEDDRAAWMEARRALDGRLLEFRLWRPDGQICWVRTRMSRTRVYGNRETDFGVIQDVTAEKQAIEAMAGQAEFIRSIAARVPGLIYQARLYPDGHSEIPFVNDVVREMFEVEPEDVRHDAGPLFGRVHPEDLPGVRAALAVSARDLTPWRQAYRVLLPSRGLRWFSVEAVPHRESDGSILWHGFTTDATEGHRANVQLLAQHRMLDAIRRAQASYIDARDRTLVFDALLQSMLDLTESGYGFVGEVLTGDDGQPYMRTHAMTDISWDEPSRAMMAEHRARGVEFRNPGTLIGRVLTTQQPVITNDPVHDPHAGGLPKGHPGMSAFLGIPVHVGDHLVAMVGLANRTAGYDRSHIAFLQPLLATLGQLVMALRSRLEHERSQAALKAMADELMAKSRDLQATLDAMNQGLAMVDGEGRYRLYNRRMLEMLDLPEDFMAQQPRHQDVARLQIERGDFGQDMAIVPPPVRRLIGQPPAQQPEQYLRPTRDGRVLEIRTQMRQDGGMVRTYTDVTSYVKAQEEVRALNATLEQRVRERTEALERSMRDMETISYSIAHDLRAPLRAVNGFASLITEEGDELGPVSRDMFVRISRASRNMGQMITDMLELLRVVRVEFSTVPLDLEPLARRAAESLAPGMDQADLRCAGLPRVKGDATLLRQVLSNLLDNAIKYAPPGARPVVELGYDREQGAFYLRDQGIGFDMARAGKLFGLFQRMHLASEVPGTGVGLAIVARIIERHGGRIWAESGIGQGSTFWWTLPLAD
ncbi:MAG: PAS-domain containing protein [Burkholderiaceae bacterium]